MALIPIEHPRRLASPAEAEAWFRAFREKRVSARGFHTSDPARFARLVAAVEPRREHTISFEGGTLRPQAFAALEALSASPFQYLDVRTAEANLRIWPQLRSWVQGRDGSIDTETTSIATAVGVFRAMTRDQVERGFILGVQPEAKAPLLRFLEALAPRVDAVLDLDVAAARALTELYAGEKLDWQAGGVLVDFPEGRIHGFLKTPDRGERDREKWLARVSKALRRAGLS